MKRDIIPKAVKLHRMDLSDWVWHLVRRDGDPQNTLRQIINERSIRGSIDRTSNETVICFSEAPLRQLINQDAALSQNDYTRLALYGVGFKKSWLYNLGALPVIYQPNEYLGYLDPAVRWRHVEFDLKKQIDYTWQREWRIKKDILTFDTKEVVLLVECLDGLKDLLWRIVVDVQFEDGELDYSSGVFKEINFIPLEYADISDDRSIEVCIEENYVDTLQEEDYPFLNIDGP